jgi:succinate dehydrogenase / fumarate reductase membrane anchor subunit
VLLLPLVLFLVALLVSLVGADYQTVVRRLASPLVWLPLLALVLAGAVHMWLGMQVIIDDYLRAGAGSLAHLLSTAFTILVALAAVYAIYQLSFGA